MRKLILIAVSIAGMANLAYADPIEDREALMKSFGKSMGQLAPIAKGEKPFDAKAVDATLATLNSDAQKFDVATLFPEGSDGGEYNVSKVWQDKTGFQAAVDKFKSDVASSASSPTADVAALQAKVGLIGGNCGGCHQGFRVKK